MFEALAEAGITIQMISTSEIKISVLVARSAATEALWAVHRAFGLERPLVDASVPFQPTSLRRSPKQVIPLADGGIPATTPPAGMEDLVISGVELDEEQARITVHDVPDRPGHAARIFRAIADAQILVDMIVQNFSTVGIPNLSFTVRRKDLALATEAAAGVVGVSAISVEPEIAKLSLLGVGMRSHTGVAMRMFGALAERDISPTLINTSEVRINVAIDCAQGRDAQESLARAFLQKVPDGERPCPQMRESDALLMA
jgi:aspartate kinase